MKVLNIDALATPKRVLNLGGARHPVKEVSAQQFVDGLKKSEENDAALAAGLPGFSKSEVFLDNVQMVLDLVPTLDKSVLMPLPLEAVVTILKFCRGDDDGIAVEEEGGASPK